MKNPATDFELLTDESLAAIVVKRDRGAFQELYNRYVRIVFGMAVHMLGHGNAEEVTQEIFIKLWLKADQFNHQRGAFKSWFLSLARNHMLDFRKRMATKDKYARQVDVIDELICETRDPYADVFERTWEQERRLLILDALQTIPAEQRQAILMAYFGGQTQSAIAKQTGWPLGTVKKRIRLGIQKLRVALQADADTLRSTRRMST